MMTKYYSCMWCKHLPMMPPFSSRCERGHLVVIKKVVARAVNKTVDGGFRGYQAPPPRGHFTFSRPYPSGAGCLDFEDCGTHEI